MPRMMLVDPLTLPGRELLAYLESAAAHPTLEYRHTDDDDEHQIAEIGGAPALVPPIEGPDELEGHDVVVIASLDAHDRTDHVVRFLEGGAAGALVVDLGGCEALRTLTRPAVRTDAGDGAERLLRVAHPALVAVERLWRAFEPFGVAGGSVAAVEPVSTRGTAGIETLASQAAARLQGSRPSDHLDGLVLAFNHVPVDASDLERDAGVLFPGLDLAITRAVSGLFHGHVTTIALDLETAVSPPDAAQALFDSESLVSTDLGTPLDRIVDTDQVAVSPPSLSASGRRVAVVASADGLRIAAATAWQLVARQLWVS